MIQVDQGDPAGVPLPIEDYVYDGEGNRLASHLSNLYASNAHNQLLEDDSYTYAYDARGNRVSRTDKTTGAVESYSYDSQNRLIGYASETTTASYAYDAMDRRIAKTVDGDVMAYVYDISTDNPLAHDDIALEFSGTFLKRRWMHTTAVDEPVGFEEYFVDTLPGTGVESAMYADRQGSILYVTDPATNSIWAAYEYDGFGAITQTQGTLEQPYGYTGREFDAESGLYYYRARSYDPATAMFVQSDPIGFGGGSGNIYSYVNNDPLGWSDPSGLMAAVECSAGRVAAGPCGTAAGSLSGAFVGIGRLAERISLQLARHVVLSTPASEDADAPSQRREDSPECQAARQEFEEAKRRSSQVGGGCSTDATTKRQRRYWQTAEVQTMLFVRLMALQRLHQARSYRDLVCHGGPDQVHQRVMDDLDRAIDRCIRALDQGVFR